MLAPNTLLQNRYQIVRSIGHGGMGAVYLARDQRLGHTVALKETFFTEERMRKAFEREARLLAHLRHPALPKVTDHFEEDGGQFIVMEFISGDDLEMLLAQRGEPFPVEHVMAWGDELLKALDYLHAQEPPILHRDIKPANLKLTPQGEVILLDFGLAKGTAGQTSSVMTSRSVFGFTPNFAPLEQIQGTGTGPRSDLYSLAATLYYLATGAIPPDALTRITEAANGQPDPLRPAEEINARIPHAVSELLMRTMAHNREQRPASAAEMRRALREAMPEFVSLAAAGGEAVKEAARERAAQSTLIEPADTQDVPAAVETEPTPTEVAQTAQPSAPELEPAPAAALVAAEAESKVSRLQWAGATAAAVLVVVFSFVGISRYLSTPAAVKEEKPAAVADASSTAAPALKVSGQSIDAPDNSSIVTTVAPDGTKTEARTFNGHALVSKVVVTTAEKMKTARVTSAEGEERDLPADRVNTALEASGDELAAAVGFGAGKVNSAEPNKVAGRQARPRPPETTRKETARQPPPAQKNEPVTQGNMTARQQANADPESIKPAPQSRSYGPEGRSVKEDLIKKTKQP
ncbi:MAG TPA: serine/threonine-protein kinase [Pyrinomonadaceae bacterium]|nr:serine/threonine-protein kinase [Pyrinomonadaceae bacterium]